MADVQLPPGATLVESKPPPDLNAGIVLPTGAQEDTEAIPQQTTEGMGLGERLLRLGATGVAQGLGLLGATPRAITGIEMTHYTPEDLAAAHDEWNAAHPERQLGKYTYNPEIQDLAKQKALARDPNARRPVFGEGVKGWGEEHLANYDESVTDIAKARNYLVGDIAGKSVLTNPTEASGRIYQGGVRGATAAIPALATGQPEALLAAGASAAGGQGV